MTLIERSITTFYDTTLRDGTQEEGVNFSIEGKLKAARLLDNLRVHYIEGGWPGANITDNEFFRRAQDLDFQHAKLAAFGSTRRAKVKPEDDTVLKNLLDSKTPVCTLVGKASLYHVRKVLRTTDEENLAMIKDSIEFLKANGVKEVGFDAEHLFDGFKFNQHYALETLRAAARGGADWIALCDTNGGTLPHEVKRIVKYIYQDEVLNKIYRELHGKDRPPLGIHTHDDLGLAVANALIALDAGATQIQGTINGYGERIGNANLLTIMGILGIKMGNKGISQDQLQQMTSLSGMFDELAGYPPNPKRPFVGRRAFTHKAGFHADGISKTSDAYEHMDPNLVGNERRVVISELSGKANVRAKIKELGIPIDPDDAFLTKVIEQVKQMSARGFRFEEADASFELLVRRLHSDYIPPFQLKVLEGQDNQITSAIVEINPRFTTSEHPSGGVNNQSINVVLPSQDTHSVFDALKKNLQPYHPYLSTIQLTHQNTPPEIASVSRVTVQFSDGKKTWVTMGADKSSSKASLLAVKDALEYSILHQA